MQEDANSPRQRLIAKLSAGRFLTSSLIIHLVLVGLLGGVVLFKAAQQQEAFVAQGEVGILNDTEESLPDAEEPPEFEEPASAPTESSPAMELQASAISTLAEVSPTGWTVSAPSDEMLMGSRLGSERTTMSTGTAGSRGSTGKGRMSGKLFGVQIESDKLGVVLDVSGSAHSILQHPLKEIEANFRNSFIILYPGCGMKGEAKKSEYDIRKAKNVKMDEKKDKPGGRSTIGQILGARKKNKALDEYLEKIIGQDNVYLCDTHEDKLLIYGVQFALERLAREGVDTIYWFADFQDTLDPNVLEPLLADLKRRRIKVICHNFAGKYKNAEQEATVKNFAKQTGGQEILKVLGK